MVHARTPAPGKKRQMICMSDTSDAGLWYALNRLETNYWWDVDLNGGRNAHEFYLPMGCTWSAGTSSPGTTRSARSMHGALGAGR